MADNFWLSDEPQRRAMDGDRGATSEVHTGPERQEDRRVISGIVHRLREGCRWPALAAGYGPYTAVFHRYNRGSRRGLWQ